MQPDEQITCILISGGLFYRSIDLSYGLSIYLSICLPVVCMSLFSFINKLELVQNREGKGYSKKITFY